MYLYRQRETAIILQKMAFLEFYFYFATLFIIHGCDGTGEIEKTGDLDFKFSRTAKSTGNLPENIQNVFMQGICLQNS